MIPGLQGVLPGPTLPGGGASIGGQMVGGAGMPDIQALISQYFANRFNMPQMQMPQPGAGIRPVLSQPAPPINMTPMLQRVMNMSRRAQPGVPSAGQGGALGRGPAGGFARPERDFREWSGI